MDKIKLIARITRSLLDRVCNDETRSTPYECRRANAEGAIDIKDKIVLISIWICAEETTMCVRLNRMLLLPLRIFPNWNRRDFVLDVYYTFSIRKVAFVNRVSSLQMQSSVERVIRASFILSVR